MALIAAVLSGVLVYGIYLMQLKQIEWQETVNVIVPVEFIDTGTVLTSNMLELQPIFANAYREGMVLNEKDLIGQETLMPLGKGEPVLEWKLNRFELLPKGNQATFQIPRSYILSISNQIRAGDRVYLYLSSQDGNSRRLFPEPTVVASVKMSSNQEVEDVSNSSLLARTKDDQERLYLSRRHANGPIEEINLNLTEEQWLELDRLCKVEGNQLVIAYSNAGDSISTLSIRRDVH